MVVNYGQREKSLYLHRSFSFAPIIIFTVRYASEYIFPRPRKVCPRDRKEVKTDFFFREKVLFSEIVGKKDRVEQLSNRAERLSS